MKNRTRGWITVIGVATSLAVILWLVTLSTQLNI